MKLFRRIQKHTLFTLIGIICLIGLAFFLDYSFIAEEGDKSAEIVSYNQTQFDEGYIKVSVHILSVDLSEEHMTLELMFSPFGSYNKGDNVLAVPLEVLVSSTTAETLHFNAGQRMFPHEVVIDFYEGEVEEYPFDQHRALFEILVTANFDVGEELYAVPTELDFLAYHHGYAFNDEPLPPSSHGYVGFDIHVGRSSVDIGIAVFWMVVIWILTFVNVAIIVGVLDKHVEPNFDLFWYMSAFILALFFLRQIFPNIPPFVGVRSDFLSVFPALIVAAVTSCIVGYQWVRSLFDTGKEKLE